MSVELPPIPPKRYFTIGEVSELCAVKPYVLRYWEQEFTQLRPMKRRGNRRYYQHHEVLLVRRIRDLLYEQRFTISGARDRLAESPSATASASLRWDDSDATQTGPSSPSSAAFAPGAEASGGATRRLDLEDLSTAQLDDLRRELLAIRRILGD